MKTTKHIISSLIVLIFFLTGCASDNGVTGNEALESSGETSYVIGPGDNLRIFVWGNTELSSEAPVRPDGRITTPLVEDVQASGKTPTELARLFETRLSRYIRNPVVTITVLGFVGLPGEQIRVVGEVTTPQTIPFRKDLTLLDVLITVGGLTEYAAGNSARLARKSGSGTVQLKLRLDDLLTEGDLTANIKMMPGDVLFVPESWF